MARAHPRSERRIERRKQTLVRRVADEQRVHVGAAGHLRAARGRTVQEQRDEPRAQSLRDGIRELLRCEPRHQNLPPPPPPEKPPPPPKPPIPPLTLPTPALRSSPPLPP